MSHSLLSADLVLGLTVDLGENLREPLRYLIFQPSCELRPDPSSLLLGLEVFVGEDQLTECSHSDISTEPNKNEISNFEMIIFMI